MSNAVSCRNRDIQVAGIGAVAHVDLKPGVRLAMSHPPGLEERSPGVAEAALVAHFTTVLQRHFGMFI